MQETQPIQTKTSSGNLTVWVLLGFFIVATILTGILVYTQTRNFVASNKLLGPGVPVINNQKTATANPLQTQTVVTPTEMIPEGPVAKAWDGASRVTILIMGLDYRDWRKKKTYSRTDTMILLTVNPLDNTAGILSIPRDLWVNIPGYGYNKINTAYFLAQANKLPDGGPGLAIKTVEQFLGVPIDYYAQIDFGAFEQFIDDIGGIDVDVPAEIKVDPIGKGNTVILQPGLQHLDGPTALAYARARNTTGADFDRSDRQHQVILAIRKRILTLNMLPNLVRKAPKLYNELSSGIHTNLTLEQAIALAWLAKDIPDGNLRRGIIAPPDMVIPAKSPDGTLDILKPITHKIRELRDYIFAGTTSPLTENADPQELMQAEGARITILNSSTMNGIATRTADFLKSKGVNIIQVGDANEKVFYTTLIFHTGKPHTLRYLIELMSIQPNCVRFQYDPNSQVDIVIQIGTDWANTNPMP